MEKNSRRTPLSCYRENSSSRETCNNGVCSTTSPGEMTSVCTCYCKREGNAARKKDNDITIHNGNRHPATGVSKKSITNRICRDDRESYKKARCVTNQETVLNVYNFIYPTFNYIQIFHATLFIVASHEPIGRRAAFQSRFKS